MDAITTEIIPDAAESSSMPRPITSSTWPRIRAATAGSAGTGVSCPIGLGVAAE
jgi:hypothetical protein